MNSGPREPDPFEELLAAVLDPGEICLSREESEELRAALTSRVSSIPEPWWITSVAAGEAEAPIHPSWQTPEVQHEISHAADFIACLSRELDPGEIAFDPEVRRELVARLKGEVRSEDLVAWALEELPDERRGHLEDCFARDAAIRAEALSIRDFCRQVEMLLPPLARPGWWERRRLQRVFSATPERRRPPLWIAAAAVVALLLSLALRPDQGREPALAEVTLKDSGEVQSDRTAVVSVVHDGILADVASSQRQRGSSAVRVGSFFPIIPDSAPREPAFVFSARPEPLVIPAAPEVREFPWGDADRTRTWVEELTLAGDRAKSAAGDLPFGVIESAAIRSGPLLAAAGRDLLAGADSGRSFGPGNSGTSGEALPSVAPEPGSLALAQSQPQILSSLLRGPVSGRPDFSRTGAKHWISGDFQAMDFDLPSGSGGVEADTWRMEAGMGWLLSPSWHAAVSLAGVESRLEVPGFGSVDVEGAAFSWSLDWREAGWHAALTHTLGSFDQDLRRVAPGMVYPAAQDATVQNLSLWLTREFEAGDWSHGPVAGIEGSWGSLEGYREPFPGGVSMAGRDFGLLTTLIGWQASARLDSPAGEWWPHVVAGWRHRSLLPDAAMVQGTAAANFVVPPATPERDSLLLEGGLRWLPPGGLLFFDAVSSTEWRDGGDSENSLLFKLGAKF